MGGELGFRGNDIVHRHIEGADHFAGERYNAFRLQNLLKERRLQYQREELPAADLRLFLERQSDCAARMDFEIPFGGVRHLRIVDLVVVEVADQRFIKALVDVVDRVFDLVAGGVEQHGEAGGGPGCAVFRAFADSL